MTLQELLSHIKEEVKKAELDRNKDAVNMYLVIKHAEQLKDMNPNEFALSVGRNKSYATEFRKAIKVAEVIKKRKLDL